MATKTRQRDAEAGNEARGKPAPPPDLSPDELRRRRQVIHWRTLSAVFGLGDSAPNVEVMAGELAEELGLPKAVLDPVMAVDALLQRYPELKADFDGIES